MNPFEELSDAKLMELYLKGESMAFEMIYDRHKGKVKSFLARRLKDSEDIAEVFQNVFLKFHKSRAGFSFDYSVLQWLFSITKSELLDFTKKKRITTVHIDAEFAAPEARGTSIDLQSFTVLNEKESKAIKLRYFSDLDYEKISKELDTSQSNARKIISRGISKLRKAIARKDLK